MLWLFPVVAVALLVGVVLGIVAVGAQLFDGIATRVLIQWVALPLAAAIAFGAWAALRHKPEPAEGIEVTPAEHPALWAEVNRLAANAQTEPPARIVIVPEVNAGVAEVGGRRELEIGLPLLATSTTGQLRSVLAHELGHFAGGDTADAARDLRRLAFLEHVRARAGVLWRWFFTAYARLYALAAGPSSRAAELRADDLSVLAAGPRVAAESFRALLRADLAWEHTFDNYVPCSSWPDAVRRWARRCGGSSPQTGRRSMRRSAPSWPSSVRRPPTAIRRCASASPGSRLAPTPAPRTSRGRTPTAPPPSC